MKSTLSTLTVLGAASTALAQYQLAQQYSGSTFFDRFDFYGAPDNLTNGDVNFVSRGNATANKLAYVDSAGHAIIKVDNTSDVVYNDKRNSVRVESSDAYPIGSVWIIDIEHLPYGCSVWPAFWTAGTNWPAGGEIDIIEQVNLATQNQMALHTDAGCTKKTGATQSGTDGDGDCGTTTGCVVTDKSTASFGEAFATAGGGVWATQFDSSGIYIWYWSRPDVPSTLNASTAATTLDTSTWGTPSAAFPSDSCAIGTYFGPQRLILDITLCGDWAGAGAVYNASSCYTSAGPVCYLNNVIDAGSPKYDNAYFDISYIRAYTLPGSTVSSASPTGTGTGTGSATRSGASATGTTSSAAAAPRVIGTAGMWATASAVLAVAAGVVACL